MILDLENERSRARSDAQLNVAFSIVVILFIFFLFLVFLVDWVDIVSVQVN